MTQSEQVTDNVTRTVVVLGGSGRVGEGIVAEWARTGAKVIVPSRTEARAAEVHSRAGDADNVHTIVGDYTGFDTSAEMADRIESEFGTITDVIASIGGWWQAGALWQVDAEVWQRYFVDLTTAHFANIRTWITRLLEEGTYQFVLGGSAYTPVPGASVISMEQAALLMMHRVLMAEAGDQRRIFALTLGPVATRGRVQVDPTWVTNDDVGRVTIAHALSTAASAHIDLHSRDEARARIAELGAAS